MHSDSSAPPADLHARTAPPSPPHVSPRAWWAVLRRAGAAAGRHRLTLMAAAVAFYAFLALVPLLGAIVLSYGLLADPAAVAEHMRSIVTLVPAEAAALIREQLTAITEAAAQKSGIGLALALTLSLYGAMKAASALMQALNTINDSRETRGFLEKTGIAAAITLGMVLVALAGISAAGLFAYLEHLAEGLDPGLVQALKLAGWIVAALLASAAIALAYRIGPDRHPADWQWVLPGSIAATLLWLLVTLGFSIYAASFGNYNATYGSLGAIVVLLFWLWLSALAVLVGAQLSVEAERAESAADK